jgi:hypothetical protein
MGYPTTTQDSLPLAGQALLARAFEPQASDERLRVGVETLKMADGTPHVNEN